jgi:hypothetical protein
MIIFCLLGFMPISANAVEESPVQMTDSTPDGEVSWASKQPHKLHREKKPEKCDCREVFLEAKAGYFIPIADRYKKVFSGSGIYGLEADIQLYRPLYFYLGADYYTESSHTQGSHHFPCSIEMIRPFAGFKFIFQTRYPIRPYLGVAFQEAYVKNKTKAHTLIREEHHWQEGALGQVGIVCIWNHFVLDIFGNYSWLIVHMKGSKTKPVIVHHQNISGFTVGGGLGYQF